MVLERPIDVPITDGFRAAFPLSAQRLRLCARETDKREEKQQKSAHVSEARFKKLRRRERERERGGEGEEEERELVVAE